MTFKLHTIESAPAASKQTLEQSQQSFGWIPNLHAVLAEAPEALKIYKKLHEAFQNTSFNAAELTVVWQTINIENQCHYCIPAHFMIANMMKVDDQVIQALKENSPLPEEKLEVLRSITRSLYLDRGHLSEQQLSKFRAVGYNNQQLLEILVGIAQKVISNYTNHLADTPLDEPFKKFV